MRGPAILLNSDHFATWAQLLVVPHLVSYVRLFLTPTHASSCCNCILGARAKVVDIMFMIPSNSCESHRQCRRSILKGVYTIVDKMPPVATQAFSSGTNATNNFLAATWTHHVFFFLFKNQYRCTQLCSSLARLVRGGHG